MRKCNFLYVPSGITNAAQPKMPIYLMPKKEHSAHRGSRQQHDFFIFGPTTKAKKPRLHFV